MVVHTRARNTFNLIAFIESLDRAEDEGAFSKDVIELYPHLRESYCQLCPVRMDIAKMKKKAELGQYTAVADIKADILRISMNCILFNGLESFMGTIAKNFERFALEKLHSIPENFFSPPQREEETKVTTSVTTSATSAGAEPASVTAAAAPSQQQPQQHKIRLSGTTQAPSVAVSSSGTKRTRGGGDEAPAIDDVVVGKVTPSASQLAEFVASLNREEDGDLFAADVLLTYPGIAESYNAVCPRRMDLSTMRKKALRGAYHRASGGNGNNSSSVSDELLEDLELIASNCIAYNGAESVYGKSALRFQSFFRSALKEFRLDPVKYLSSRRFDGVEIVDRHAAAQQQAPTQASAVKVSGESQHAAASVVTAAPKPTAVPKQTAPPVAPREYVTPAIRTLPFQVVFHIPDAIRKQIVTTHIVQEFKDCVLLQQGDPRTVRCAVTSFLSAIDVAEQEAAANAEKLLADAKKFVVKEEPPAPTGNDLEGQTVVGSTVKPCGDGESTLSRATSAFVALRKLKIRRTEVAKLLHNMLRLFDDVAFPDVLLYRKERSDVDTFLTRQYNERRGGAVVWSEVAHVEYFIRFLVHFPQLAAVACARSAADSLGVAPGRDHHSSSSSAKFPTNVKRMPPLDETSSRIVCSAVEVIENFLCFADAKFEWAS